MMQSEKFWTEDPCALFTEMTLLPSVKMSREEKLNSLTRLIILITIVMYAMGYKNWLIFVLVAVLAVILLNYCGKNKDKPSSDEDEEYSNTTEDFTITPTYSGMDLQQTIVAPTFAEEWQIPPPAYDLYESTAPPDIFEEPLKPQSYPYGQYLTKTNLLPSDEYYIHMGCGGAREARSFANSSFLRNDIAFRDNMMKIHKKKLSRRFRHENQNDSFSPYHSY